jgi:DNA-binding PadR family transcriptional regulator
MRRKAGSLVPLEAAICLGAANLRQHGQDDFHGYEIAKHLGDDADHRLLTAYGTLYRALGRLEKMGMLTSRWEDPQIAADENRPGRRIYTLTAEGERAAEDVRQAANQASASRKVAARPRRRPLPA